MIDFPSITVLVFAADLVVRLGLAVRVLMRRLPVGVTLAWLVTILVFPLLGAVVYLLIGELRLGSSRAARIAIMRQPYRNWLAQLRERAFGDWGSLGADLESLARLAENVGYMPPLAGNRLELLTDAQDCLRRMVADIDASQKSCHLEFYIWNNGGLADEVGEALMRAVGRGVACRVLLDAVGSHNFLQSEHCRQLAEAGVQVQEALPAGLIRMFFVRFDLRLHRKIVVIDGQVGYTGSMNLVDPPFFVRSAKFGKWIDAMVRVEGPVVEPLAATFLEDWSLEADDDLVRLPAAAEIRPLPAVGESVVQVLPSGPMIRRNGIREVLLTTIYAARRELVLTTPYFVPDEALLSALISAANRGVDVRLILPARSDSLLVRLASRAHFGDLIEAGVKLMQYPDGLLHTKSVTVDGRLTLIGSLNLDPRSMLLNFEITLAVYGREFTSHVRALQQQYLDRSHPVDLQAWKARSPVQKFADNVGRLWGPLL